MDILSQLLAELPVESSIYSRFGLAPGVGEPVGEYICGGLRFDGTREHPLLSALPPVIHVRAGDGATDAFGRRVRAVTEEARAAAPGAETVMARLSEVLFVHAVRHALSERPAGRAA